MKKHSTTSERKYDYIPLTPKEDIENSDEYFHALDWALDHGKIKNVALAGPYGSGKSSIIDSFFSRRPDRKCLRISMATFIENAMNDSELQSEDIAAHTTSEAAKDNPATPKKQGNLVHIPTKKIEEGILRQLFYKVDHTQIPQSRFRKLHKLSFSTVYLWLLTIMLLALAFSFIFYKPKVICVAAKIVSAGQFVGLNFLWTAILTIILLVITTMLLARVVHFICTHFRIKGGAVSAKNTSAEITSSENDSALDKHMDEIIYFFEETKYRIVVFEDLDRLNDATIFVRLRELNTVLNNCDTLEHPIIFVYAVRDDIFKDADRTKFFDFIIPVVPIINSTNSGEELKKMLDKLGNHNVSARFVEDVAPYISDMRTLINIFNEFIVYKNMIIQQQEMELSDEKMLALIVFKNLYPRIFSQIQMEEGIIKQAFDSRAQFIAEKQNALDLDIANFADKLECIKSDFLRTTQELKAAMLCALIDWNGIFYSASYLKDYSWIHAFYSSDIMGETFDLNRMITEDKWQVSYFPWGSQRIGQKQIPDFSKTASEYKKRIDSLAIAEENRIQEVQQLIASKRQLSTELAGKSLATLMSDFGSTEVLSSDVRENDLLVFLLRNGYIDEQYASYINYFKGTSVTIGDQNFVLAIKNQKALPFEYSLTKLEQLLQRLQTHDFKHKAIYNYSLLNYLLSSDKYEDKLEVFVEQLSDGTDDSWKFIDGFFHQTVHHTRFISLLAPKWQRMWDTIYSDVTQSYERQLFYFRLLVDDNNIEAIVAMNENGNVSTFLTGNPNILQQLEGIEPRKIIDLIRAVNVKFTQLNTYHVADEVLDFIFGGSYYVLNYHMIQSIVTYKAPQLTTNLATKNFTTIKLLDYKPLLAYIHENLTDYVQNIVLADSNTQEDVVSILRLLRHLITEISLCDKVIAHQQLVFDHLSDCCNDLLETNSDEVLAVWNSILMHNKLKVTWQNAMDYWNSFELTDELNNWLANHCEQLCAMECDCVTSDFINQLIQSDLDDDIYGKLLTILHVEPFEVKLADVSVEKVEILIALHYFPLDALLFKELHLAHPELCISYVFANIDKYEIIVDELELDETHIEQLIISNQASLKLKEGLLKKYGVQHMSHAIAYYLVRNSIAIDVSIFREAWALLDLQERFDLMMRYMSLLDADDFEVCFSELGEVYAPLAERTRRHDVSIEFSDKHSMLADRLKEIDYITSQKIQELPNNNPLRHQPDKKEIVLRVKQVREG